MVQVTVARMAEERKITTQTSPEIDWVSGRREAEERRQKLPEDQVLVEPEDEEEVLAYNKHKERQRQPFRHPR